MILDDIQALAVLKKSQTVPKFIKTSRKESEELFALLEGVKFDEVLINRVEFIESEEKAQARKKYSRDITPLYQKILNPVSNVYSATGGSKLYNIDNEKKLKDLLLKVGRVRSGKSLQEWLRATWMPLYHADPNGVIFMEYKGEEDCWPTYKNIDHIRSYVPRGQMVEWILFEPVEVKKGEVTKRIWRLVDDKMDRRYLEDGGEFKLIDELTFEHPFGQTPALINSDIEKLKFDYRISPIDKIVELSKEFARDQSIKTIFKKYHGFPMQWKYEDQCKECQGAKKDKEGNSCKECDGHGYYKSKDVTDMTVLAIPEKDEVVLNPVSGYVTPPIDIWKQYNEELDKLSQEAHETHWGTMAGAQQSIAKTATEIIINSQPMIDRLDSYSDIAEMMEGQLTEWIANFTDPAKKKDERIASINYGRRFIIDPPEAILMQYEKAKEKGDNNVILDRLLNEYFTAKYKNDPEELRVILLKSNIEPYIHLSVEQVITVFGNKEAQRKVLFEDWWNTLTPKDLKKPASDLKKDFDKWFTEQQTSQE